MADWVQYLLDNFATVGEAVADARSGRYRLASVGTDMVEIKLHLFVHDRGGNSAVLEYLDGKLVVHENPAVRVLTNSPYAQCCAALPSKGSAWKSVPGGAGSLDRFLRGAYYLAHVPPPGQGERGGGHRAGCCPDTLHLAGDRSHLHPMDHRFRYPRRENVLPHPACAFHQDHRLKATAAGGLGSPDHALGRAKGGRTLRFIS